MAVKRLLASFPAGVIVGVALTAVLLAAARHARPAVVDAADAVDALAVALADVLAREEKSGTKELYVRSAFAGELVPKLQLLHPSIQFRDGKGRPTDDGCRSSDPDNIVLAPCERPDFVRAEFKTAPMWRTFLVGIGIFNGGCEVVMVKSFSKWRVVSNQCSAI
jgi:hypothetical protein